LPSLDQYLHGKLQERKRQQRYRSRICLESSQSTEILIQGSSYLNFCSNDYLGLANHPELSKAMIAASEKYGVGSGASHLVCGHSSEHHALEDELADFTGRERALLFSTGYMANLGVIAALTDRHDTIFQDKLNHASLLDGAQLSRAKLQRYRHGDTDHLHTLLNKTDAVNQLIVTDSVFSMDGDIAPLSDLASVAKKENSWLMVDDAHGIGVLGQDGAGAASACGLNQDDLPILIGTLGKAFGTFGAFVAGSEALIETLIQLARSYIYTTAMPASVAGASRTSLRLVKSEQWRRDKLYENIRYFKRICAEQSLTLLESDTAIQPLFVGSENDALKLSEFLRCKNILVSAIRPPTVPEGTSRLRITLCATHETSQLEQLVDVLSSGVKQLSSKAS